MPASAQKWDLLANIMERELLHFPGRTQSSKDRCLHIIATNSDVDEWISLVELACRIMVSMRDYNGEFSRIECDGTQEAGDALEEINVRFRENAFGYQFENEEFVKVEDQYIHSEIVKPALQFLTNPGFEKASEDFMTAHRHYRAGETKDAIVAAGRAFESTLKAICKKKKWKYPEGARAKDLISAVRNGGLFPDYLDEGLSSYIATLKTGLPGVRNNAGGHGSGPESPTVPAYLAAYTIHLTAANILLAISALESQK